MGRCGPGCTALNTWTYDCGDHDRCGRVHGGSTNPWDSECGQAPASEGDRTVLATVDGQPITARDVAVLLPEKADEPVRLPGVAPPDPRQEALRLAIRNKLLAREALARGLIADPAADVLADIETLRVRALLDQERAIHGLAASAVGDGAARR